MPENHDQLRREGDATLLMNNALYVESFEVLREDLMNRWTQSGSSDLEARESI